jgi:hypothetical protein
MLSFHGHEIAQPIQPHLCIFGPDWQCYLAGKSQMAFTIFDAFNFLGLKPFLFCSIEEISGPQMPRVPDMMI